MHGTRPKTNAAYWTPKIARNVERDRMNDALLNRRGWRVLRVWEHEAATLAANRVEAELKYLSQARCTGRSSTADLQA